MVSRFVAPLILLVLAGCNETNVPGPQPQLPAVFSFELTGWSGYYSPGVVLGPPPGTPAFVIPEGPEADGAPSIHYLTRPTFGAIGPSNLSATYEFSTTGSPILQFRLRPNNTCDGPPASVSLYFQRRGDDMSGSGEFEHYRWFSSAGAVLKEPSDVLEVPLAPAAWISVMGKTGNLAPVQFAAALANVQSIGMTFGGGCFKGHGVNVKPGSGTALFALRKFELK